MFYFIFQMIDKISYWSGKYISYWSGKYI